MRSKRITLVAAGLAALGLGAAAFAATAVKPYVEPVGPSYAVEPLFSAGDKVPLSGNPAAQYRMVGFRTASAPTRAGRTRSRCT